MSNDQNPQQSPFHQLKLTEKRLVYRGLLLLVRSNSGHGFQNSDQGHLAYAIGRSGQCDYDLYGDSPERNKLFGLMHSLSVELSEAELDQSAEIPDYIFSWADFCHLAYAAYEQHKKNIS